MSTEAETSRPRASGGASQIMVATLVAGVAGYLVTWAVYRFAGPAPYAVFVVFWAALYLLVGALSGIQQEITRATFPIAQGARQGPNRARDFGLIAAASTFLAVVATAALWVHSVFPIGGWALVWPLATGSAAYVLVAALSGSLYGVSQWRSLALMIMTDAIVRLALVGIILITSNDIVALAWAAALPFPLTIMLLWPFIRRPFVGRSDIDVAGRALAWNVARTVLAAASTSVLVSAFPLLLGLTSQGAAPEFVGELAFTMTLTRAPLVVSIMALQSYLVVQFRERGAHWPRLFGVVLAVIAIGGAVLAVGGWLLGPAVFELVSGAPVTIDGGFIAAMVASSALIGILSVTGSAVLARGRHFVYSAGWTLAAIATIGIMSLPNTDLESRVMAAILIAPVVGLLVHASWLVKDRLSTLRLPDVRGA